MRAAPKVTRRGRCARRSRGPGERDLRDGELAGTISEARAAGCGVYGAPEVFAELKRAGVRASRKRVARVMRENGWVGTAGGGCAEGPKGRSKRAAPHADAAPGLVRRDFAADGPNRARFADIAYVRTRRGRLHLAVVMGVRFGMIFGWSASPRMTAELADDALGMAMARWRPSGGGCVHHSGRGPQHASLLLGKTMRDAGV